MAHVKGEWWPPWNDVVPGKWSGYRCPYGSCDKLWWSCVCVKISVIYVYLERLALQCWKCKRDLMTRMMDQKPHMQVQHHNVVNGWDTTNQLVLCLFVDPNVFFQ